jgi:Ser/Thr protein kinase RdoA (MazF antagonist)
MSVFDPLSPQAVVQAVESFSGLRMDGSLVPYNSYINRVFGLRDEDGQGWVAKFYRPGRWDEQALTEEHAFVADCAAADLPVARPRVDTDGQSLGELVLPGDGGETSFFFALFEKKGGRSFDAEGTGDWLRLGRLLGRLHAVGRQGRFDHRPVFTPEETLEAQIDELLDTGAVHPDFEDEFDDLLVPAARYLRGLFPAGALQRIHGDVHRGNILDRPGEGLLLMDFDDCAWGPPVQDLWLLLPGHREDCRREIGLLTEGYGEFSPPEALTWDTVEALRLMRMVHFLAWCARQRTDRGFDRTFPDWGSKAFWIRELESLGEQVDRLAHASS